MTPDIEGNSQDLPGDAVANPPPEMAQTRILSMPDSNRYVPQEPQPGAMIVLRYDPFMEVVRELAGGSHGMQLYGSKLEGAVAGEAQSQFQAALETARNEGYVLSQIDHKDTYAAGFEAGKAATVAAGTALGSIDLTEGDAAALDAFETEAPTPTPKTRKGRNPDGSVAAGS